MTFLPFELGIHKAHIIFCDEAVGEIQYTIIGKAELPEILDTFSGECNSEVPYQFTKVLNYRNDKLEQARNQILEKDKKERKNLSSHEGADARAGQTRKDTTMSAGSESKQFEIEISNPFFTGQNSIMLQDLSQTQKPGNQIAAKNNSSKDAKVSQNGDQASTQNVFVLNCNPTKPASFTCYVILKSIDRTDIRLYEFKLTAIPQKIKA